MGKLGKTLLAVTGLKVSNNGQYLAVLDIQFTAAVFKVGNLQGKKPIAFHDFKSEYISFSIISGP